MQPNSMGIDLRDSQCHPFYRKMKELDMVTMGCMSQSESILHLRGEGGGGASTLGKSAFPGARFNFVWIILEEKAWLAINYHLRFL